MRLLVLLDVDGTLFLTDDPLAGRARQEQRPRGRHPLDLVGDSGLAAAVAQLLA